MQRRRYLALAGLGLSLGIAGCSDTDDGNGTYAGGDNDDGGGQQNQSGGDATPTDGENGGSDRGTSESGEATLDTQEFVVKEGDYSTDYAVTGEITNSGEARLSYVEGTAKFYDSEENLLDSTMVNLVGLDAGETWEFWAPYIGSSDEPADGTIEITDTSQYNSGAWPDGVTLVEHSLEEPKDEYSGPRVVGRAKNETGSELDYLEAHAKFYAENENVLSSAMTNVTNLGDGETWKFELEFSGYNSDWEDRVSDHKVLLSTLS